MRGGFLRMSDSIGNSLLFDERDRNGFRIFIYDSPLGIDIPIIPYHKFCFLFSYSGKHSLIHTEAVSNDTHCSPSIVTICEQILSFHREHNLSILLLYNCAFMRLKIKSSLLFINVLNSNIEISYPKIFSILKKLDIEQVVCFGSVIKLPFSDQFVGIYGFSRRLRRQIRSQKRE